MRSHALADLPIEETIAAARDKGKELLESDAAQEIARRGRDVVKAARGSVPTPKKVRRWPMALGALTLGAAAGAAAAYRNLREPAAPWQPLPGPANEVTAPPTAAKIDLTKPTPARPQIKTPTPKDIAAGATPTI